MVLGAQLAGGPCVACEARAVALDAQAVAVPRADLEERSCHGHATEGGGACKQEMCTALAFAYGASGVRPRV
jgi:hypothetical protein